MARTHAQTFRAAVLSFARNERHMDDYDGHFARIAPVRGEAYARCLLREAGVWNPHAAEEANALWDRFLSKVAESKARRHAAGVEAC